MTDRSLAPAIDPAKRRVYHVPALHHPPKSDEKDEYVGGEEYQVRTDVGAVADLDTLPAHQAVGHVVSSFLHKEDSIQGWAKHHAPVLDLDIPARLVPSTTEGHTHLYLDVELTWGEYVEVLEVLGRVGILEAGYVRASIARGASFVRAHPGTKHGSA